MIFMSRKLILVISATEKNVKIDMVCFRKKQPDLKFPLYPVGFQPLFKVFNVLDCRFSNFSNKLFRVTYKPCYGSTQCAFHLFKQKVSQSVPENSRV